MTMKLPVGFTGVFTYVDCGAVGDDSNLLLDKFEDSRYIGFDPGLKEIQVKGQRSFLFPVAVAEKSGLVEFHRTKNPNCSSFYRPNHDFLNEFLSIGDFFEVIETTSLQTAALGDYLQHQGIMDIDFIELDTQGSELGILQGAKDLLSADVLGVRVEVEFAEMYENQPMFGDVDSFLRRLGFRLFDLDRYHVRRNFYPEGVNSREQILWGQALYLRDFRTLSGEKPWLSRKFSKLAVLASHYGFHSYSLDVVSYMAQQDGLFDPAEKEDLQKTAALYLLELKQDPFVRWARRMDKPPFRKLFRRWWQTITIFYEACRFILQRQKYFWKD